MSSSDVSATCAGKTFEHHGHLDWIGDEPGRWRCAECGTEGDYRDANEHLMQLIPRIDAVRAAMNLDPVLLLPSDSPPKRLGQFMGCDLYRVRGIDRPLVALRTI